MDVAILGAGQGWHLAELERALRARGHRAHVLRVSALVARMGDRPRLEAGGVALRDVGAALVRTIPKGSLEQVVFRVDALHWLERLGIPVMNPATAIEEALRAGIEAACRPGVIEISAGNYGGKLGKHHFRLHALFEAVT